MLERWSSAHRWVIRALCYDNYLDLQQQKRYEQTMFDEAGRRAKQARDIEERALARVARIDLSQLSISELLRMIDLGMWLETEAYTYYEMA